MKYYIREIRPCIQWTIPRCNVGCAVDGYGWVPEDMEEELRQKIVVEDPLAVLVFKERFVEVQNGQI